MVFGLYSLAVKRLSEIKCIGETIPFSTVYQKLCSNYSINKKQCMELLLILRDLGFIEIKFGKGVKILKNELTYEKHHKEAKDLPKTCINQCRKCKKDFEAEITIGGTCDKCYNKLVEEANIKVKEALNKGSTLPEWILNLKAVMEEYDKK